MEWLLIIFYVTLFSVIIYRVKFYQHSSISSKFFLIVFGVKILCAWSYLWLLNNYGIGGDSIEFLLNSKFLTGLFSTDRSAFFEILTGTGDDKQLFPYYESMSQWFSFDSFFNDSQTLIRINAMLNFITLSFYKVNAIWFAFFSMTGCMALFKLFDQIIEHKGRIIFVIVFLIPSCVFWLSGISKEAWLIFILGIFLYSLYQLKSRVFKIRYLIFVLIIGFMLAFIKVYFLIALLPVIISFIVAEKLPRVNALLVFCCVYILGILILISWPGFDFLKYVSNKQHDFISYTAFMQSNSIIAIPRLEDNLLSFIINAPVALWNILTRPYAWEVKSVFWLLPVAENLLIILAMTVGCIGFKFNRKHASVSYAALFFSVSILILIGLTTPVIGSMLRYKAPLLPFLLMFFVFHFDMKSFKSKLKLK